MDIKVCKYRCGVECHNVICAYCNPLKNYMLDELHDLSVSKLDMLRIGNKRNKDLLFNGLINCLFHLSNKEELIRFVKLINPDDFKKCMCGDPSDYQLVYKFNNKVKKRYVCEDCFKQKVFVLISELYEFIDKKSEFKRR